MAAATENQGAAGAPSDAAWLVGQMQEAVIAVDLEFRAVVWSPGAERLYGWSAQEATGRPVHELIAPFLRDKDMEALLRRLFAEGPRSSLEERVRKDGLRLLCESTFVPLRGRDGQPAGVLSVARDAGSLHQARQRAVDEARLHGLAQRLNEAELVLREDGTVLEANDRAVELYGRPREQLVGLALRELRTLGSQPAVEAQFRKSGGEGGLRFETEHRRADGTLLPVEVSSRRFEVAGARYVHVLVRDLTEQRRQAAGLRLLAGITRSMSDAVIVADPALRITEYTGAAERIYGWRRDEVMGKSLGADFETEFRPGARETFEARIQAGEEARAWVRARRKDGSWAELDLLAVPLRGEGSKVTGWLSVARDVGEQAAGARALEQAEARLRLAARAADLGTYAYDFATGQGFWSPELRAIWGRPDEAVVLDQDGLVPFLHPGDRAAFLAGMRRANDPADPAAGPFRLEYRILLPGGEVRWLRVSGQTSFAGEGPARRPASAFGAVMDVTAQVEAAAALRGREERLRSVLDSMAEGVVVQAADGSIESSNAASAHILGLTHEQLQGRTSLDPRWRAVHEDGSPFPGEEHPVMVTLRTGQPQRDVVMGVHLPAGGRRWISISSEPLREGPDGPLTGAVGTFTDISAQQEAIEAARLARDDNQRLVTELKQALAEVRRLKSLVPGGGET